MSDDMILPFSFSAVGRKKLVGAFDGGRITSDGGVLLLRRRWRARSQTGAIRDW